MKKLLLGNAAIAQGAYEAGVHFVSSYPGTPSTEITECMATYPADEVFVEWAPNEKVAAEAVVGASIGGGRSMSCCKHVGLNVMADPLFTMSYTGVGGGAVFCVADDPGMHSSQNEQDSRHYAEAAKLPMLEPSNSEEAKEFTKLAFELSEEYDTPVIIRMCTRIAHSQSSVEIKEPDEVALKEYTKNPRNYIMAPANAIGRHPIVEARQAALTRYAESSPLNRVEYAESELGIITSGTCYQYVKEILGDSVSVLKLGMVNPLPTNLILDFASKVKRLVVIEELDPFIENYCKSLGLKVDGKNILPICGEFSQSIIAASLELDTKNYKNVEKMPTRPPVMCAGCPHRGLFYVLAKKKITVLGDIGCYTLGSAAPLGAIDSVICMGASVSGVHGFNKARGEESEGRTVAVIGDSTFMHSGMTGLANIAYNGTNSTVIIVDNSITGMTGHQQNPTTGYNIKGDPATKIDLEALCHALGINRVRVVDPYDLKATETAVMEEIAADEPSVIISRRPCALLKYVKAKPALNVDTDKCRSCKMCMKIGCPAISMKDGKAKIDSTLCVGCDVCKQLCTFDAIGGEK